MLLFKLLRTYGLRNALRRAYLFFRRKLGIEALFYKLLERRRKVAVPDYLPSDSIRLKAGAYDQLVDVFGQWHQMNRETIIRTCKGECTLFSSQKIQALNIKFNVDPVEDIEWPVGRHYSSYFQFDDAHGDIKRVWELNRLQFLNVLGTAQIANPHDEVYARVLSVISQWLDSAPPEHSVAWACSQEISIRSINLLFYIQLFPKIRENKVFDLVVHRLAIAARHVYRDIEYASLQRNNHVITEAAYLILYAHFFPQAPTAYKKRALDQLRQAISDQFFADGAYIQNSHTYHRFALQSLCVIYEFIDDVLLSNDVYRALSSSKDFLINHVANEEGDFPNYGPNDSAMLFNFGNTRYRDLRPLLNLVSFTLNRTFLFDDPATKIDTFVLRPDSADAATVEPPVSSSAHHFPSGYHIFRNGETKVFFRCGSYDGRFPSQCDSLHVDVWRKGINILRDRGSYEYFSRNHGEDRFHEFLSTASHNTVRIGGLEQIEKGPRFTWLSVLHARLLRYGEKGITGEHYGYKRRVNPNTIHRRSVDVTETEIVVTDRLTDVKKHRVEVFWHLPGTKWQETKRGVQGACLRLEVFSNDLEDVDCDVEAYSPSYGSVAQGTRCVASLTCASDEALITTRIQFAEPTP